MSKDTKESKDVDITSEIISKGLSASHKKRDERAKSKKRHWAEEPIPNSSPDNSMVCVVGRKG